jgi:hypothetical protein
MTTIDDEWEDTVDRAMTDRAVQPEAPTLDALREVRERMTAAAAGARFGYHEAMQCVEVVEASARAASQERPQPERRTSDYHPDELIAFDPRPTGHPRTYSLVGTPHRFLVTDDESGRNIGYADEIGGPLVSGVAQERPSIDVAAMAETLRFLYHADEPCDKPDEHRHDHIAAGIAGQYPRIARLAGGSVASPEPSDG